MAQDPLRSGWSPYGFVHNDPLTYVDPLGLSEEYPDYWAPELVVCAYSDCTDEPFSDLDGLTWRDAGGGAGAYVAYYYNVWLTYGEHGRRALQAYDGLDEDFAAALVVMDIAGDVATFGLAGATRTIIDWQSKSTLEKTSAALTLATSLGPLSPLGKLASLAKPVNVIKNPWNAFQASRKGLGLSRRAMSTQYYWWRHGYGSSNAGVGYQIFQAKRYAVSRYNTTQPYFSTGAAWLGGASAAFTYGSYIPRLAR